MTEPATREPAAPAVTEPHRPEPDRPERRRRLRTALRRARPVASPVVTALATVLVFLALVVPADLALLSPQAALRIPVEGLVAVLALLVLPPRVRRVAAVLAGLALGVLAIIKAFDMAFDTTVGRPFDPVMDWTLLRPAQEFLTSTIGHTQAVVVLIGAAVLLVGLLVAMTASVVRLTRLAGRHRTTVLRTTGALGLVWVTCTAFGVQFVPDLPVASTSTAALAYDHGVAVRESWREQRAFEGALAVDPMRDTPASELLTGLRGKDVVVAFVESYGRDAVESPDLAPQVDALLDAGSERLGAAGFTSRSAFLTSPTTGNGSWLAHATLLSGLWVDHEQRHRKLMDGERFTLGHAFGRAGWRTVGVMPGVTRDWPEGKFYGYDKLYDERNLGYRGPNFSWAPMPDQYALSAFDRLERSKAGDAPVMAEIPLVSSHAPWTPIPQLVDWKSVGDGSVFAPMAAAGEKAASLWRDSDRVRAQYRRSVEYSLSTLISYVETHGDDDLVLVFLGDHQPPVVSSGSASWDVPITVVAKDPNVANQLSQWGWDDGLNPSPGAKVWRMDTFRDRFLTTFSR